MDFFRGQNTPYLSWDFDFKYDFGPKKLTGLLRNSSPRSPTRLFYLRHQLVSERTRVSLQANGWDKHLVNSCKLLVSISIWLKEYEMLSSLLIVRVMPRSRIILMSTPHFSFLLDERDTLYSICFDIVITAFMPWRWINISLCLILKKMKYNGILPQATQVHVVNATHSRTFVTRPVIKIPKLLSA